MYSSLFYFLYFVKEGQERYHRLAERILYEGVDR